MRQMKGTNHTNEEFTGKGETFSLAVKMIYRFTRRRKKRHRDFLMFLLVSQTDKQAGRLVLFEENIKH